MSFAALIEHNVTVKKVRLALTALAVAWFLPGTQTPVCGRVNG